MKNPPIKPKPRPFMLADVRAVEQVSDTEVTIILRTNLSDLREFEAKAGAIISREVVVQIPREDAP